MRLIILDRDGVINEDRPESVRSLDHLRLLPGVGPAVAQLNQAGYAVAIATNQAVVGRGHIDLAMLDMIHAKMLSSLAGYGGRIDRIYVALETPEHATSRRKPGPGMLLEALRDFSAVAGDTFMIGDDLTDLSAAAAAACRPLLVRTGKGQLRQDACQKAFPKLGIYEDLGSAVISILAGTA